MSTINTAQEIKANEKIMSHEFALHLAPEMVKKEIKQTGRDIFKRLVRFPLEEPCMVPLLCNNHRELWTPLIIFDFASLKKIKNRLVKLANVLHPRKESRGTHLNYLFKFIVQDVLELRFTDSISELKKNMQGKSQLGMQTNS